MGRHFVKSMFSGSVFYRRNPLPYISKTKGECMGKMEEEGGGGGSQT